MNLPYLTSGQPGIGGMIKHRPTDFFVEELPLYEPSGRGPHLFCGIEKVGLTTFRAIQIIAEALGVSTRDIGYAGLKDARAVARQVISIAGVSEQAVRDLRLPGLNILWTAPHANKLRLGHLRGNRFAVRIRQVGPGAMEKAASVIGILSTRGVPNYFGEQRFGRRGNNDRLGAALVRGDHHELLRLLLGDPDSRIDDAQSMGARQAYERRELQRSARLWPRRCGVERRILARLLKTGRPAAAVRAIDRRLQRLWVSAFQSSLFNQVLARRIQSIDRLLEGDLAMKHDNGACFRVQDPARDQPRCDALQISPTGPLIGYRMSLPAGQALAIEQSVFREQNVSRENLRVPGRLKVKGARRALRARLDGVDLAEGADECGPYLAVTFTLPAGAFATAFLRELMKTDPDADAADAAPLEA